MIHGIDESLRALVRRDVVQGAEVDVLFEAPTKEWAARRNSPTIDIYLYDIREDLRRRQAGLIDIPDDDGHTVARRQIARFFKLSYLLTAWTQRPEDEHRLLAELMACFLRHDHLPQDVLAGALSEMDVPFSLSIAIPPPEDRSLSDVWTALGGELKPSLDLIVVAPFDLDRAQPTAPPVTEPTITFEGPDGQVEEPPPARPIARAVSPTPGTTKRPAKGPADKRRGARARSTGSEPDDGAATVVDDPVAGAVGAVEAFSFVAPGEPGRHFSIRPRPRRT